MTDCYYLYEENTPCPNEAEHVLLIPTDTGSMPALPLCNKHAIQLLSEVSMEEESEVQHA